MPITLTPDQEAWVLTRIATRGFASAEEAAHCLIDECIAAWAEEERRRKKDRREVLRAGELSDADLDAIAATEMDPRHTHLDDELR